MTRSGRRAVVCVFVAASSGAALAAPYEGGVGRRVWDSATVEATLVRQDQSDCTNSNVSANDPDKDRGIVIVNRLSDGTTQVKVGMTVRPNTTYHFFLKCVRELGTIVTDDEGEGHAAFSFRTGEVGNVYGFDMYPTGPGLIDKYQSVQVRMP